MRFRILVSSGIPALALTLSPLIAAATGLDCAAMLRGDRQRPTESPLRYQLRGTDNAPSSRCEGLIRQDHGGTPELVVRRYSYGDLVGPAPATGIMYLAGNGLAAGEKGHITLLSKTQGYRLDAEVEGAKEIEWPLTDVAKRLPLDVDSLFVLGRLTFGAQIIFFPVVARSTASAAPTSPGPPSLSLQYTAVSPTITAFLGTSQREAKKPLTCAPVANAGPLKTWRHIGGGDILTVPLPAPLPANFCIRFEIQTNIGGPDPLYDRQELYFVR